MARYAHREMSVDEYEAWLAASNTFDAVAEAADEAGGPALSLVPAVDQNDA